MIPTMFMKGMHTRGGIHYPALFNADEGIALINKLFETKPQDGTNRLDQETLDRIGYERSYFALGDSSSTEYKAVLRDAVDFLMQKCDDIGKTVPKPFLTVIEYQPNTYMIPHNDKGVSSPLFSMSGRGNFETFDFDNPEVVAQITRGEYPDTPVTSLNINPGDVFLSFGSVLHGFRNGPEPRTVVGLLDGTII